MSMAQLRNRAMINTRKPILNKISGAVAGLGLNRLQSDVVEYENLTIDNELFQTTMYATSIASKFTQTSFVAGEKWYFRVDYELVRGIENTISSQVRISAPSTVIFTHSKDDVVGRIVIFESDITATAITAYGPVTNEGDGQIANWSNLTAIKMSNTRYEDYTAEQMNEAFPPTLTTSKAIVPQKPIRVYRDFDMAEMDIGLIGNKLDTASLLAFAGAGSAYVVKIYDQTNNGNNTIQSVASNCPRIVNQGVLEVDSDGDVAPYYDGVDDRFDVVDNQGLDITSGGLSLVVKHDPDTNEGYILCRNSTAASDIQYALYCDLDNTIKLRLNGTANFSNDLNTQLTNKINIGTYDSSNIKMYLDSNLTNTSSYSTNLITRPNIQIGCRSNSADGTSKAFFYTGHISDIIIFNRALTQAEVTKLNSKL